MEIAMRLTIGCCMALLALALPGRAEEHAAMNLSIQMTVEGTTQGEGVAVQAPTLTDAGGQLTELFDSGVMCGGVEAQRVDVDVSEADLLYLIVTDGGAGGGEIYTDDTGEVLAMELNIDTLTIEGIVFVRGSGEQNALLPQMQGFWQVCGATEYPPVNDYALGLGKGIEFWGEQMDFYDAYLVDTLDIDFEFTDSGQMHYIEDGDEYFVNVYFETVAGEEMLVMTSDSGTIYLMRSTYQEFMGEERDNRVAGMWYDETGFGGTVQFFKDDRISITMIGVPFTGTYSFEEDSGTGQITIDEMSGVEMDEESAPFILDDGTLEIDGSFYTREYVPQMDY